MEWMKTIGDSIQYIEDHLLEELTVDDIAESVNVSSFYFQKGFSMMCGYTVAEYIRNRRLALAGNEIVATNGRIIDIALKYGYDSPDSFTKAFTRFHGSTPNAVRSGKALLKAFAPLKIKITLEGGNLVDYRIESKEAFTVIGNAKLFNYENSKSEIPNFWDEHFESGKGSVVCGMFGVCIDENVGEDKFEYMIADPYKGQVVPEGFKVFNIPAFDWAVFPCRGPMPDALQKVTELIYTEWLPGTKEYGIAAGYSVEMYDDAAKYAKGLSDENYYSEVWIPVKKK